MSVQFEHVIFHSFQNCVTSFLNLIHFLGILFGMFLQLFSKNPFWNLTASSLMCNSLSKFHNCKYILPVVLFKYEMCSLTQCEEHKLEVSENSTEENLLIYNLFSDSVHYSSYIASSVVC